MLTEKPDEAGPVTHSVPWANPWSSSSWANPCRVDDAHGNEVKYCIACCQASGWCEVFVEAGGHFLIDDGELVRCWIKRPGPLVITPMEEVGKSAWFSDKEARSMLNTIESTVIQFPITTEEIATIVKISGLMKREGLLPIDILHRELKLKRPNCDKDVG